MSKIVIFGVGKYAEVVYHHFTHDSPHQVVAFAVDGAYRDRDKLFELPVVDFETLEQTYSPDDYDMFIALGYQQLNQLRADRYLQAKAKGYALVSYISSRATNFGRIEIGDNCLILEHNALQPMSRVGNNVTLWCGNHVGHHSCIQDHCYLAGQVVISGSTVVGAYSFIGVNATVGHEITVGDHNLIGAGTFITKTTEPYSVYIQADTPKYRLDTQTFLKLTRL